MHIRAQVDNSFRQHQVSLQTNDSIHSIEIPPRAGGYGSRANGGELLFLALATCYCNDLYREAGKRGITVEQVHVTVEGDFGAEGEPARNITYRARVAAHASEAEIRDLLEETDRRAEIQNTLRLGAPVTLVEVEAESLARE